MFQTLNQNLKEIKEGILNVITGRELSTTQKMFISLEKDIKKEVNKDFKELNTFILYEESEELSTTARKRFFVLSILI